MVFPPATPEAFSEYVARIADPAFLPLLVCADQDDHVAGVINISNIFYRNFCNATIGYWIGIHDRGKGFMTEAVSLVLTLAFRRLDLHRIEANVQPGNDQSKKLLARVGFRLEGFSPRYLNIGGAWKDHERWAICFEDFVEATANPATPIEMDGCNSRVERE